MADKLMNSSHKNTPYVDYNNLLKHLDTQKYKPFKIQLNSPKSTNKKQLL